MTENIINALESKNFAFVDDLWYMTRYENKERDISINICVKNDLIVISSSWKNMGGTWDGTHGDENKILKFISEKI